MKSIKIIASILLLNFSSFAQNQKIVPLNIGDKVPEQLINPQLYNKGLLILNFWATWCVPCVRELPFFNQFQEKYKDQLNIVCASHESEKTISDYLKRNKNLNKLSFLSADTLLIKYFPHQSLPHNIWIGKDGTVLAITIDDEVTEENIATVLSGKPLHVETKKEDLSFDIFKTFHVPDSVFTYRSIITPYNAAINNSGECGLIDNRYLGWNTLKTQLLWHAYMKTIMQERDWNYIEIHTKDSTSFFYPAYMKQENWQKKFGTKDFNKWLHKSTFCYELSFKKSVSSVDFHQYMVQDLIRYFNVTGRIEMKENACLVLTKIPGKVVPRSTKKVSIPWQDKSRFVAYAENRMMKDLIADLSSSYGNEPPFVDHTGIEYPIDFLVDYEKDYKGEGLTLDILKRHFREIGIELKREKILHPFLVLTDHHN